MEDNPKTRMEDNPKTCMEDNPNSGKHEDHIMYRTCTDTCIYMLFNYNLWTHQT